LLWVSVLSLGGAILFHLFEQENLSLLFFVISFVLGIYTFYNSVYIGDQRIGLYNALTVLQPVLALILMLLIYWTIDNSVRAYFIGYALSTTGLTLYSFIKEKSKNQWEKFTKDEFLQSLKFGLQTQLSDFLQFFNTRLSYYFLAYYAGNASVGVFSICVSLSEAMLVVGRSISMVQYSRLLEQNTDKKEARKGTNQVLKLCFFVTLGILVIVNLFPSQLYVWVFGPEFESVKMLLLFLSPGILVGSVADIIGHYFSAMGQLRILVLKSVVGVLVTTILSVIIISKWQINGAVIVNLTANVVTSLVLFLSYRRDNF
jgi:O-antigen/teichoic acid export membrane protein